MESRKMNINDKSKQRENTLADITKSINYCSMGLLVTSPNNVEECTRWKDKRDILEEALKIMVEMPVI